MAAQPSWKYETLCAYCEIHPEKGRKWACDAENCKIFEKVAWQVGKLVYIKFRFATVCLLERCFGLKKIRKKFKKHLDKSESCAKLISTQQKQAKVCVMIERFGWSLFESFLGSSFAVGADVLLKGFRFWKKSKNFEKSIWQIGKRC